MVGPVGLFVGISLNFLLSRFLSFSADSPVAALVMRRDRVSAGHAVTRAADPFEAQEDHMGRSVLRSQQRRDFGVFGDGEANRNGSAMHRHRAGAVV